MVEKLDSIVIQIGEQLDSVGILLENGIIWK